jgi:RNA polymerase sigma-54 factor
MLKQTQTQKQTQKILPQIIQRQSLLTIPTIALEQMIKAELEANPLLEEAELETPAEKEEAAAEAESAEASEKDNEEYDWDDFFEGESDGYKTYENSGSGDGERVNYEEMWKESTTLSDSLLSQLYLSGLSDKETFIGEDIIGNLDDDGYLRDGLEEIKDDLEKRKAGTEFEGETFTVEDIENVLKVVQRFDPIGIASRDLKECLIVQVHESNVDDELKQCALKVLTHCFEEFRLRNYEKIIRELNINQDMVNKVFDFILKLNPKPGFKEVQLEQNYIYPDLIVTKVNGEYQVMLNERNVPTVRVNNAYKKMILNDRGKVSKETKDFVMNNFERAKWFLDAIKSRRETMQKVMNSILIRQFDFFENMGEGLKPMYEKDVAEDISMDISTVSRTVRGKYVQTDFGIYELKFFFSNFLTNEEGDDISTKEIKNKLREVIQNEDPAKPFTDDELCKEMSNLGFKIARRTVAKYREAMNIPKARLRRKLV